MIAEDFETRDAERMLGDIDTHRNTDDKKSREKQRVTDLKDFETEYHKEGW